MNTSPEQQFRTAREMLERALYAGDDRALESVLEKYAQIATDDDLVVELIYNEYLIREEQGESPKVVEFLNRFPNYAPRIRRLFDIHATLSAEQTLVGFDPESLTLPRRLSPGDTVGPFELISSLGTGGRGFVFKARQVELNRIVALKILKGNATNDQEIRRFLSEAKAAANLQHPNIVQVYESDIYENLPYIALEYVAGGTLDEQYSGVPVAGKEAAQLVATLAEAMHYAHERGVVHRDLKPSNILLAENGTPKITDFGLAKRLRFSRAEAPKPMTETGMVLGTPSYMAPEQAEGRNREVGPGTDVYGLGVVLYQLITGQVPFVGESTLDVLESIRTIDPVAPSSLNPKVPPDLETICLKCLEKEPTSRYLTAADLAADLHRFVSGHPIVARPASSWQRFIKLARRHPVTTALSGGLIAAVLIVIGVISWQWKQAAIGEQTQAMLRNSAEESLYSQQLALAHKELKSSESQRALEVLEETDPLRRHWEWDYLRQSCDAYTTLATLGPDTTRCVASPDGSLLAVVKGRWGTDEPGTLAVFDTKTQKLIYRHENAFGPTMDVAFSPNGEAIATACNKFNKRGGQIVVHEARTGEAKKVVPFPTSGVFGIAYHPSQPQIAVALANHSVEIWDSKFNARLHRCEGHRDSCYRVAFSPTGDQLASCSRDRTARLWNVENGKQDAVLRARNVLRSIAYTPDGRYVVTNGHDQAIQFWDLLENPPQHSKIHLAGDIPLTYDVSISPQGRFLRAFGDGGRRLFSYDLSLKRVKVTSAETAKRPARLAHHPSVNRLYLVDTDGNVLQSNARRVSRFQRFVTASATDIAVNPADDRVAIASGTSRATPGRQDFRVRMLSVAERDSQIQFYEGAPTWASAIAVSSDGQFLAGGCENGSVLLWEANSGKLLATSDFHEEPVVGLAFAESGNQLISVSRDGWLAAWKEGLSAQPRTRAKLTDSAIGAARFTADATHLILRTDGGQVSLLNIDPVRQMGDSVASILSMDSILWETQKSDQLVQSVAFSAATQHVAIATDDSLEVWATDPAESRRLWSVAMPFTSATDIAFHPDGKRMAVVDGWNGRVLLFTTDTGQRVLELETRSGTDRANIAFSSDGDALVATLAGELYVWSLADTSTHETALKDSGYADSQYKSDFQWHVNQASEQIYGGWPFGAEFHATSAMALLSKHEEKIDGLLTREVLTLNAKCHLAKSLIDSGRATAGEVMFDQIVAECPNNYRSLQAAALLLATYPGPPVISTDKLVDLADRALALRQDDSNAWATAGIAHFRDGNLDEARRHLAHAESILTGWDGLVLFPLAVVEARSGDRKTAAERYARGVEWMESITPNQPIIRELHGWAAAELAPKSSDIR